MEVIAHLLAGHFWSGSGVGGYNTGGFHVADHSTHRKMTPHWNSNPGQQEQGNWEKSKQWNFQGLRSSMLIPGIPHIPSIPGIPGRVWFAFSPLPDQTMSIISDHLLELCTYKDKYNKPTSPLRFLKLSFLVLIPVGNWNWYCSSCWKTWKRLDLVFPISRLLDSNLWLLDPFTSNFWQISRTFTGGAF